MADGRHEWKQGAHIDFWGSPKIRDTFLGDPITMDSNIWGSILGSPHLGKHHSCNLQSMKHVLPEVEGSCTRVQQAHETGACSMQTHGVPSKRQSNQKVLASVTTPPEGALV